MIIPERLLKDPFRLLFPAGLLLGVLGVLIWVPYGLMGWETYPGRTHADLMLGGFLMAFVTGFLQTAIPRFTDTAFCRTPELAGGLLALLGAALASLAGVRAGFLFLLGTLIAVLLTFIIRRVRKRKSNPPGAFVFVGVGLLLGFFGSTTLLVEELSGALPEALVRTAHGLLYQGMILSLVLGVGARLIPGILGWQAVVAKQKADYEREVGLTKTAGWDIRLGLVLFIASYCLEGLEWESLGRPLRAVVVSAIAFRFWRFHLPPPKKSWMNRGLLTATWGVVLGEWLAAVVPSLGKDGRHLTFIAGFSLLTLLIASRVTLAHGKEGLGRETLRWPYLPLTLFLLTAAVARVTAIWLPESYFRHLAYASILWTTGICLWGSYFLPRILGR